MYWSPYFLAVVFKKQEISQQVLYHNFYLIVFFRSNKQGHNHGRKSWNFRTDLAIEMLVVCSDIHVLWSPLMSVSSQQNEGFSIWVFKKFQGAIPPVPYSGRPPPSPLPARPVAGRGAQAPLCWDPNLGPLNFSAVVAPLHIRNTAACLDTYGQRAASHCHD